MASIYGYIRVSTKDQNEQRQLHNNDGTRYGSLKNFC